MGSKQKDSFFITHQEMPAWDTDVVPILKQMSHKLISPGQLIQTLIRFHEKYCNKMFKQDRQRKVEPINLRVLEHYYKNDLSSLLKRLATFLLNYKPGLIPLILSQTQRSYELSKRDMFYLVVLMFMGLVPKQEYHYSSSQMKFNSMNSFGHILSYSEFKTKCIVEYLKETIQEIPLQNQKQQFIYIFRTFTRQNIEQLIKKEYFKIPLTKLTIESDQANIEEFNGQIKVDFANKFIGGGCLRDGCVQEEIMFAIRPELYATTLLCEKMQENQALGFSGFRRYFDYKGYGDNTTFAERAKTKYQYYDEAKKKVYNQNIVAVDALKFKKWDERQFSRQCMNRQIKKAYTGFKMYDNKLKVITGGWGCGAFNGDFSTKVIIQWIAASMARKNIVICPFGRKNYLEQLHLVDLLKKLTVGEAYQLLINAGRIKYQQNTRDDIVIIMGRHLTGKGKM